MRQDVKRQSTYNQKSTQPSPHCPWPKKWNPSTESLQKNTLQDPPKTPQGPPRAPKILPRSPQDHPKITLKNLAQKGPPSQRRNIQPVAQGNSKNQAKSTTPPPPPTPPRIPGSLREVTNEVPSGELSCLKSHEAPHDP